jgi:hypothetical protein
MSHGKDFMLAVEQLHRYSASSLLLATFIRFFFFLTLVSKLKINKNSKTIKIIFNFMSFSDTFFKEKI